MNLRWKAIRQTVDTRSSRNPLVKRAFDNSLKKAGTAEERALLRFWVADNIRGKGPKAKRAWLNSLRKYGFDEAAQRKLTANGLRFARRNDKSELWGVSFNASLSKLDKEFYAPIGLTNTIRKYLRKRKTPSVILDLGCGNGKAASDLQKVFRDKRKVKIIATGLKPLKEWERYPNSKAIDWKVAHVDNLPKVIQPGSIDFVHANLVIQHTVDFQRSLTRIGRVMKKGGLLLFTSEFETKAPIAFETLNSGANVIPIQKKHDPTVKVYWYLLRKK
jgi:ubiquinone/menaquinone biosynthesis C-methylase UbiE